MTEPPIPDESTLVGDGQKNELTTDIVCKVAEVSNTAPTTLPPLYSVIDTDALNALVSRSHDSRLDSITFQYHGYTVTVTSAGDVRVSSTA